MAFAKMVSIHVTHVAGGDNGLKNGDLGGGDGGAGGDEGDVDNDLDKKMNGALDPEVLELRRQVWTVDTFIFCLLFL